MLAISYFLLIFVCISGLSGLFLYKNYVKKISSLSVAYSSLIVLLLLIAYSNNLLEKTLTFFISLLLIFSINLMIALGIIKNIGDVKDGAKDQGDNK
ncbi:MAG: hypothetical protein EBT63_05555 [Proteobacteria bacterium]|nr:hypothetical protein [Pseudomonadota bacterium]NCA28596.1 hypothetical protein [Pseudomonadota bacterium]